MNEKELRAYDPANAKELTQEQLTLMSDLTKEDYKLLAEMFPNTGGNTAYLILKDKSVPDNKQIFPRSTWKNYYALLTVGGAAQKNFVPISFTSIFKKSTASSVKVAAAKDIKADDVLKSLQTEDGEGEPVKIAETAKVPEKTEKAVKDMNKKELLDAHVAKFGKPAKDGATVADLKKLLSK